MTGGRLVVLLVLLGLLGGMFVHYGAVAPSHDPTPSAASLAANYSNHVGDAFYGWGRVTAVDQDAMTVETRGITLAVDRRPPNADPGDTVQLNGTLAPNHNLAATRVIVSDATALKAMYVVSGFAALLTAGFFFRHWTVDFRTMSIVARETEA